MSIIITETFKKEYYKKYKKYFDLKEFSENLKEKQHNFIDLHSPFFKVKQNMGNVDFRSVIFIQKENKIIPLLIFLKKDKKFWENVSWKTHRDLILDEYEFALENIENWDFDFYS